MLRVFRVLRLFKRVPWLKILFNAIIGSLYPGFCLVLIYIQTYDFFVIYIHVTSALPQDPLHRHHWLPISRFFFCFDIHIHIRSFCYIYSCIECPGSTSISMPSLVPFVQDFFGLGIIFVCV